MHIIAFCVDQLNTPSYRRSPFEMPVVRVATKASRTQATSLMLHEASIFKTNFLFFSSMYIAKISKFEDLLEPKDSFLVPSLAALLW